MSDETKYPDTFREWMEKEFSGDFHTTCEDISSQGCSGGFPGLTYYKETCALYEEYKEEIWDALNEDAEAMGFDNILAFVAEFGEVKDVGSGDQFHNLLVWYLAERIAHKVANS